MEYKNTKNRVAAAALFGMAIVLVVVALVTVFRGRNANSAVNQTTIARSAVSPTTANPAPPAQTATPSPVADPPTTSETSSEPKPKSDSLDSVQISNPDTEAALSAHNVNTDGNCHDFDLFAKRLHNDARARRAFAAGMDTAGTFPGVVVMTAGDDSQILVLGAPNTEEGKQALSNAYSVFYDVRQSFDADACIYGFEKVSFTLAPPLQVIFVAPFRPSGRAEDAYQRERARSKQ